MGCTQSRQHVSGDGLSGIIMDRRHLGRGVDGDEQNPALDEKVDFALDDKLSRSHVGGKSKKGGSNRRNDNSSSSSSSSRKKKGGGSNSDKNSKSDKKNPNGYRGKSGPVGFVRGRNNAHLASASTIKTAFTSSSSILSRSGVGINTNKDLIGTFTSSSCQHDHSGRTNETTRCLSDVSNMSDHAADANRPSTIVPPTARGIFIRGGGGRGKKQSNEENEGHRIPRVVASSSFSSSANSDKDLAETEDNSDHGEELNQRKSDANVDAPLAQKRLTLQEIFADKSPSLSRRRFTIRDDDVGDLGLPEEFVNLSILNNKPIEEIYSGIHDGDVLGEGICGVVRRIVHRRTGKPYALKRLDLTLVKTEDELHRLKEEIYIMCQLDHPNILSLIEVYESTKSIYLVGDLLNGGELFDRLDEQPDYRYTEAECARLVSQMLCAVRHIHSKGIVHRDLKLENFLFESRKPDAALKMIDFGLSKHFNVGDVQCEMVGTPYTVAPEVILGRYDETCDIWGVGVLTFFLLSGDPPFGGCGGPEPLFMVRENILCGRYKFEPAEIWQDVSDEAKQFISALLVTNPNKRPTAAEAQNLPWLAKYRERRPTMASMASSTGRKSLAGDDDCEDVYEDDPMLDGFHDIKQDVELTKVVRALKKSRSGVRVSSLSNPNMNLVSIHECTIFTTNAASKLRLLRSFHPLLDVPISSPFFPSPNPQSLFDTFALVSLLPKT